MPPDVNEEGKLNSINLLSFERPHMRAFHFAWFCFFLSFFAEFTIPPLFPALKLPPCESSTAFLCRVTCANVTGICQMEHPKAGSATEAGCEQQGGRWQGPRDDDAECRACFFSLCGGLGLSHSQVVTSNVLAVSGTVLVRVLFGSIADVIGARTSFTIILCVFSLPLFFAAAVHTALELYIVRFLLGFIGASFVVSQVWTSQMFAPGILGLANATVAGWGNLGGGVSNLLMPLMFAAFKGGGLSTDLAWRTAVLIPSIALMITGIAVFFGSDDEPRGNLSELRKAHPEELAARPLSLGAAVRSMGMAARNYRTWVLFLSYAGCFGIEMAVNANIALYLHEAFGVDVVTAGAVGSLFGLMNLFARSLGGFSSDLLQQRMGARGRLWGLLLTLLLEGLALMAFASVPPERGELVAAAVLLVLVSLFTQMAEGCTFGVVPLVDQHALGGVAGIVGAGGNVGAVLSNLAMAAGQQRAFWGLGVAVVCSSMAVLALHLPGEGSVLQAEPRAVQGSGDGDEAGAGKSCRYMPIE